MPRAWRLLPVLRVRSLSGGCSDRTLVGRGDRARWSRGSLRIRSPSLCGRRDQPLRSSSPRPLPHSATTRCPSTSTRRAARAPASCAESGRCACRRWVGSRSPFRSVRSRPTRHRISSTGYLLPSTELAVPLRRIAFYSGFPALASARSSLTLDRPGRGAGSFGERAGSSCS